MVDNSWFDIGKDNIWPPYTQVKTAPEPIKVESTNGCLIKLADGRELIDGISSWWSACHGYNHPHIISAMKKQLDIMPHVMFAGTSHEQAYLLANRLSKITPEGLEKVFFSDSGSVAVEVAMKMAVQYHHNNGNKKKTKFISFKNGYHGDTMGTMSLCDPENGMHKIFSRYMPGQYVIDIPSDEYGFIEFDDLIGSIKTNVAGIIIEPLIQGAGGMKFHTADILAEIRNIAKKHDIIFIADEIATGFGRTGSMFACDEADISPDIMCIGKALTGGVCSLAATIATDEIFKGFISDNMTNGFMHGPTYMANPLACAAANASLDLFEQEDRLAQIAKIETILWDNLKPCTEFDKVIDVRIKGAMGVIELDCKWQDIWNFRKQFLEENIWLRPFGNIIYVAPPFTISKNELIKITDAIIRILNKWHGK